MSSRRKNSPARNNTTVTGSGSKRLGSSLLSDLAGFVEMHMGLYFPAERFGDLERNIGFAAREFGYEDAESCARWLLSSPLSRDEIENFSTCLAVGETYFFRDAACFDALREDILPELIRLRQGTDQRLRIWSAGCSTGEEAYSIAILLDRIVPHPQDWDITILATDINPDSLKKAAQGTYREWSFRGAPEWVKRWYFARTLTGYVIHPRIRDMVTFRRHNLATDTYPTIVNDTCEMDIILCRNVLLYFSRERGHVVTAHLHRCLVDNGWLIVSPVESTLVKAPLFENVRFPGTIMHKKNGMHAPGTGAGQKPAQLSRADKVQMADNKSGRVREKAKAEEGSPRGQGKNEDSHTEGTDYLLAWEAAVSSALQTSQQEKAARAAADKGQLADALRLCEKSIDGDKLNQSLYYLQGTILQEMGRTSEAAVSLKRAIYIDQGFVLAHFTLGLLTLLQERRSQAEKHLANARALLAGYGPEEVLPQSEGITANRLSEIIDGIMARNRGFDE